MGKFVLIFLSFLAILAGCESKPAADPAKKEILANTEKSLASAQQSEENPQQEQEETEEAFDWSGEWVFLSDDNLGNLKIEKVDEETIRYHLGGSVINPVNGSSYANVMEGTGMISGNTITYTNELSEDCGGTMERNGNIITVTAANGACHTPQVYLDGDYIKADSLKEQPLLEIKNGQFLVRGISMWDTPSTVKEMHGNPAYEGPDEEGFYEWIQDYEDKKLFVSYSNNQPDSVHTEAPADVFLPEVEKLSGERYTSEDANYIYLPEKEQLLIYQTKAEDPSVITLFTAYADGNFHAGVENGWIVKEE